MQFRSATKSHNIETIILVNTYINRKPHKRDTISNLYQSYTLVVFVKNMRVEAVELLIISAAKAAGGAVACRSLHMHAHDAFLAASNTQDRREKE